MARRRESHITFNSSAGNVSHQNTEIFEQQTSQEMLEIFVDKNDRISLEGKFNKNFWIFSVSEFVQD